MSIWRRYIISTYVPDVSYNRLGRFYVPPWEVYVSRYLCCQDYEWQRESGAVGAESARARTVSFFFNFTFTVVLSIYLRNKCHFSIWLNRILRIVTVIMFCIFALIYIALCAMLFMWSCLQKFCENRFVLFDFLVQYLLWVLMCIMAHQVYNSAKVTTYKNI